MLGLIIFGLWQHSTSGEEVGMEAEVYLPHGSQKVKREGRRVKEERQRGERRDSVLEKDTILFKGMAPVT
jgi:hypothetical protein